MNIYRKIQKVITGQNAVDGAGVKLVRVIGRYDVRDFDPFLMLDAFDSRNKEDYIKGFPWHPHRGIETVTYLVSGEIEHGDSLGNNGSIKDGGCQWMTAGSGIIHQELPKPSERLLGVQLWLNLPSADKMTEPKYRDLSVEKIPVAVEEKGKVHIISGHYKGMEGATQGEHVKLLYLDVELEPGCIWEVNTDPASTAFAYVLQGRGDFQPEGDGNISEKHGILFGQGDTLRVKASEEGVRFLLFSGKPLREPIAWGGPIVMNTRQELEQAFRELDENTFIK
ncbi:MAG: pirin family protein [Pseudomonadota bacterium]